jgi:hypothetical protein
MMALGLAAATAAQTTGIPGLNDYTINGVVSGSATTCLPMCFTTPTTLSLDVSTLPTNAVLFVITDCPCRLCAIPWTPNACLPPLPPAPFPPCNGGTNQSLDIFLAAPGCTILWSSFAFPNAAGLASVALPIPTFSTPPCQALFSTQAIVFDFCGTGGIPVGPGPFVLTQAYTLAF